MQIDTQDYTHIHTHTVCFPYSLQCVCGERGGCVCGVGGCVSDSGASGPWRAPCLKGGYLHSLVIRCIWLASHSLVFLEKRPHRRPHVCNYFFFFSFPPLSHSLYLFLSLSLRSLQDGREIEGFPYCLSMTKPSGEALVFKSLAHDGVLDIP